MLQASKLLWGPGFRLVFNIGNSIALNFRPEIRYQKIWTTMAERDGIDVRFGVQIQSTWHARVMKFGSVADLRWSFMVMRYDCNH